MSAETDASAAALEAAALDPLKMTGEAGSAENHRLPDLIAYDRYVRSRAAAQNSGRGLRITRLVMPGPNS